MIVAAASMTQEMQDYAVSKGAKGIILAGMCCTANEILLRHGLPTRRQLPAAGTGHHHRRRGRHGGGRAVHHGKRGQRRGLLPHQADHHQSQRAKIASGNNTVHIEFDEHHAASRSARRSSRRPSTISPNRRPEQPILIPSESENMVVGFSSESIKYHLGGTFRGSYVPAERQHHQRPDPRHRRAWSAATTAAPSMTRPTSSWSRNCSRTTCIVLTTGCNAMACGKAGLLTPEAARVYCGPGLAEVCETVGIPAGPAHGLLRGQLPHPHRRLRGGQGRRPLGKSHRGPARRRFRPRVDERERPSPSATTSWPVRRIHGLRRDPARHRRPANSRNTSSRNWRALYGGMWDLVEDPYEHCRRK